MAPDNIPPAPGTAPTPAAPPGTLPGPAAFGYALASRPGSSGTGASTTGVTAQNLPANLLGKIFGLLAHSTHSQCALVCHHWHRCLPRTRIKLALWLEQNPCLQQSPLCRLAPGCSRRTYPWLASQHCALLPELRRQHRECILQQERLRQGTLEHWDNARLALQRQQAQTAESGLAGLLRYSLHQQTVLAPQLPLEQAPISWPPKEKVMSFLFSPCSRWLATGVVYEGLAGAIFLRLHGWHNGSWIQQNLPPTEAGPASIFEFPYTPPDTLLAAHTISLLAWQREPDTNNWHSVSLGRTLPSYRIYAIATLADGDIIALSRKKDGNDSGFLMLICSWQHNQWAQAIPCFELTIAQGFSCSPRSHRLALMTSAQDASSGRHTSSITVWHKNQGILAGWISQVSVLDEHNAALQEASLGPQGDHLLGRLSNGQLRLWPLDAHCNLLPAAWTLSCDQATPPLLSQMAPLRGDGRQFLVALSMTRLQFVHQNAQGEWQLMGVLDRPPEPDDRPEPGNRLRAILLSASGQTLVWLTNWWVEIWHQDMLSCWRKVVRRTRREGTGTVPQACLLPHGETVCTTAADPTLSLWVHGLNSEGELVRKACIPCPAPLSGTRANSPDGLSLMLGYADAIPTLLHMAPHTHSGTDHQGPGRE